MSSPRVLFESASRGLCVIVSLAVFTLTPPARGGSYSAAVLADEPAL